MIGASFDSTKTPLHDLLALADALLQRITVATDKTVARKPSLFRAGVAVEAYDEGPQEWDAEEPLEEAES
jgi:hypothetical protein